MIPDKEKGEGSFSASDNMEADPEFQDSMEEMTDDFFKETDPEFHALLKKVGGHIADEDPTEED